MNWDFIVVGLGNPGSRYAFTRHNAGFIALDLWAQEQAVNFDRSSKLAKLLGAEVAEVRWKGKKLLLLKPQTFMNLSGQSLAKLYQKHSHCRQTPLAVLHDEVDIPLGKIRVKMGGGDAGNNGLRSIRQEIGHGDSSRIRIGVGRPEAGSPMDVGDWVLQEFGRDERDMLLECMNKSIRCAESLIEGGLKAAKEVASLEKPR